MTSVEPMSEPVYLTGPPPQDPPAAMAFHEKSAMRAAAMRAKRLFSTD